MLTALLVKEPGSFLKSGSGLQIMNEVRHVRFQGSAKSEMLKKLETFRADLLKALDRIHGEDFGICADCKNPITSDRLLMRPDERFCLSCESGLFGGSKR